MRHRAKRIILACSTRVTSNTTGEGSLVSRTADPRIRSRLLRSIVEYVLEHGVADLSLRPLAEFVEASPRTLLYHFGSREALIVAALEEANDRQLRLLEAWYERSAEHDARTLLLRAWQWLAAPRHDRLLRLGFETSGYALRDRKRYAAVLRTASTQWIGPVARALGDRGFPDERATALAALVVGVMRGLLFDMLATGDRARAERAFRSFINAIELPQAL
jgi:AcrR family transcriptional regulator